MRRKRRRRRKSPASASKNREEDRFGVSKRVANQRAERIKRDVTSGRLLPEVETLEENRRSVQTPHVASLASSRVFFVTLATSTGRFASSSTSFAPPSLSLSLSLLPVHCHIAFPGNESHYKRTWRRYAKTRDHRAQPGRASGALSYSLAASLLRQLAEAISGNACCSSRGKRYAFPRESIPFTILTTRAERNFASRLSTCWRASCKLTCSHYVHSRTV